MVNNGSSLELLLGLGIGTRKRQGDIIQEDEIERRFILQDNSDRKENELLLSKISTEYIEFSMEIVEYIQNAIEEKLDHNLLIVISDHIYSSIKRYRNGIKMRNLMLLEIKSFFRSEFEIGLYVTKRVEEQFGVQMLEDEAAFIALHIVNANFAVSTPIAEKITRFIEAFMTMLLNQIDRELDMESFTYFRFVTHLKYLARRVLIQQKSESTDNMDSELLAIIKVKYEEAYKYAKLLKEWIYATYCYEIVDSDSLYLTIHIQKLITSS